MASIGKPRGALRAAFVHTLFNVAGVLLWLAFIGQLADLVQWLSPSLPQLSGSERLAAETPRQIANAHTVFNVVNTLVFLPFAPWFGKLAGLLAPDRPAAEEEQVRVRYLDEALLATPSLALDRVRLEILRLGDRVKAMVVAVLPAIFDGTREELAAIAGQDDAVDALHGKIVTFLGKVSQTRLSEQETQELLQLLDTANDLENMGDIVETNLVSLGERRLEDHVRVSQSTRQVLTEFHDAVVRALDASLLVAAQKNQDAAGIVVKMKKEINRLAAEAALHGAERLVADEPNRMASYAVEMNVVENLKRIFYFCKRMARTLIQAESKDD